MKSFLSKVFFWAMLLNTGVTCQANINECEGNPCDNGGVCEDGVADFTCHCPPRDEEGMVWGGKSCSVELTGCLEHNCNNGATCVPLLQLEVHTHLCSCPPGFYDASCSTSTTFSLSDGFVVVQGSEAGNGTSRRSADDSISISMSFRTTLPDSLLIHRGNLLDEYIRVQIFSGKLMSMATISGQILGISFSESVDDGAWHQLRVILGKNLLVMLTHPACPNQTCSDSKPIKSATLPPLNSFQPTHIGGEYGTYFSAQENFTGCMRDLEVDNEPILPQTISDSLAWNFKLGCEKTDWCEHDPCHGNGKCVDLWTSYACECFRPYVGPTCTQEYKPVTFSHNNSSSSASFVITDNPGSKFVISFYIRTRRPSGLILQLRNATAPYLTVYLRNSGISFKAQGTKLASTIHLADGTRRLVEIHLNDGWLTVKESKDVLLEGLLPRVAIHPLDTIRFGHDTEEDSALWGGLFKGCLQDVKINDNRLEFFPMKIKNYTTSPGVYTNKTLVNVLNNCISDDSCKAAPCHHGGTCIVTWNDFECKCPRQYTGLTCEDIVWCRTDPCLSGSHCRDIPGGYECHSNATFQGKNPIVYLGNDLITRDLSSISVNFKTRDTAADLLQVHHGAESFWLGLHNSQLQFKLSSGNSVEGLAVASTINTSDGQWHSVLVTMEVPSKASSRWTIVLDGKSNVTSSVAAGNINFLQDNATVTLGNNFTGCLGVARIGGIYLPYMKHKILTKTGQFAMVSGSPARIGCFGGEVCTPNPCLNEGRCEDLFDLSRCQCAAGWEGSRCEHGVDNCAPTPCVHGNCSNSPQGYRCDCELGYAGPHCDSNVDDCVGHQCQNNASCVDALNSYYCQCPSQFAGRYCEWPNPPIKCGEGFVCGNGGLCTDGPWGANCTCVPGFSGERCEVEVNACECSPCQNGATCQSMANAFECICAANYAGQRCELDRGTKADSIPLLAVAVPVVCGSVLLIVIALIFVVLTARKKRQTEGTYNPSQQEVAGARLEMDSVLKVPPEERLI